MNTKARLHIGRQLLERAMAVLLRRPAESTKDGKRAVINGGRKGERRADALLNPGAWAIRDHLQIRSDNAWASLSFGLVLVIGLVDEECVVSQRLLGIAPDSATIATVA